MTAEKTNRVSRREFLKTVGIAAGGLALASCGATPPPQVVKETTEVEKVVEKVVTATPPPTGKQKVRFATWMVMEGWGIPASEALKARFETQNPGYELEFVGIPAESMNQQLTIMAAGGEAVDVAHVVRRWGPQLGSIGALEDLTKYLTDEIKADLYPWMITGGTFGDWGMITVPFSPGPFMLCTNLKALEQAGLEPKVPETWDELVDVSTKVGKTTGEPTLYGWGHWMQQSGTAAMWALDTIWAMGGHVQKADNSPEINGPENEECWKAIKAWYDASPNAWTKGIDVRVWREYFGRDQLAFCIEGPWMQGVMREVSGLGEAFDSHWVQSKVPVGATGESTALESSTSLCMFKQSKVKEGAAGLINIMVGDKEWQREYNTYSGEVSPLMSMASDPQWADRPFIFEQLKTARAEPVIVRFDAAMEVLSIAQLEILDGADIHTTLDAYQEQIKRAWA
jgi:multiple sugar transport system substrate-binding protein